MTNQNYLPTNNNAKAPLVSIVIPTFNRLHLLLDAVKSCFDQTYPNIEIIIIDDGSIDGTDAYIAQKITDSWQNCVRYYKQKNSGASAARNKGLELATGKYVQFLDSDDVLFKDKITLQVTQLEMATSEQELCSCFGRIGSLTQELAEARRIGIQCTTPTEYIRQMSSSVIHGMQTSAPLWSRSFLINRAGWRTDISLGDDLEYYLRLLSETRSVGFVAQDLFLVREHDGPHLSDSENRPDRVTSAIQTLQAIVETVRNAGIWDSEVQAGIFRKARTLYANILQCGTKKDIFKFEDWIKNLHRESKPDLTLVILLLCRRFFGKDLILLVHGLFLRLRTIGRRPC